MAAPNAEMLCAMAAVLLFDQKMEITDANIAKLVEASGASIEPYWPNLFAQALKGADMESLLSSVGAAPAGGAAAPAAVPAAAAKGEEKKEEKKEEEEEEEEDMGFGLFD